MKEKIVKDFHCIFRFKGANYILLIFCKWIKQIMFVLEIAHNVGSRDSLRSKNSPGAQGGLVCKICPIILTLDPNWGPQGGLK